MLPHQEGPSTLSRKLNSSNYKLCRLKTFETCWQQVVSTNIIRTNMLVCWWFEPSKPERITPGLETNVNPSPTYSAPKSWHRKFLPNPQYWFRDKYKIKRAINTQSFEEIGSKTHKRLKRPLFNSTKQGKTCKFSRKSSFSSYLQNKTKTETKQKPHTHTHTHKINWLCLCQLDAGRLAGGKGHETDQKRSL